MKQFRLLLIALILFVPACASGGAAEPGQSPRRQANLITQEELRVRQFSNAYEAVRSLRPQWLQQRGAVSIQSGGGGPVILYVDNTRFGTAAALSQIQTFNVVSMQYIEKADATTRWGTGHMNGAILVTTQRRGN